MGEGVKEEGRDDEIAFQVFVQNYEVYLHRPDQCITIHFQMTQLYVQALYNNDPVLS